MARCAVLAMMLATAAESARSPQTRRDPDISIVNGKPADECEWKHQVGLSSNPGEAPYCGGMLISEEWVLTAAHCFGIAVNINVVAGEWNTTSSSGKEQNRMTVEVIKHPLFSIRTLNYDFALLKLESPVTFNDCVGAVRLPSADVAAGTSCWTTGWGTLSSGGSHPTILQEAQVTVISNSECMSDYGYSKGEITDKMICAQGRNANGDITDACQGDSGGPLVCKEGGSWVIHGATSWGEGCGRATHPGVWARVYAELDWINAVVAGARCPWYCRHERLCFVPHCKKKCGFCA